MRLDLWLRVFCSYMKDYAAIEEWLGEVERLGLDEALKVAGELVEARGPTPQAITLGFSPQILIASLALNPRVIVVTSPEVLEGKEPAQLSHKALSLLKERVVEVYSAPFAPSQSTGPGQVIEELASLFGMLRSRGVEVLDISGGTQLVPIAAVKAGVKKLTYAYPTGKKLIFHELKI